MINAPLFCASASCASGATFGHSLKRLSTISMAGSTTPTFDKHLVARIGRAARLDRLGETEGDFQLHAARGRNRHARSAPAKRSTSEAGIGAPEAAPPGALAPIFHAPVDVAETRDDRLLDRVRGCRIGRQAVGGGRIDRAMLPACFDEALREVVWRHVGPFWLAH